jgi:hypothetical protein
MAARGLLGDDASLDWKELTCGKRTADQPLWSKRDVALLSFNTDLRASVCLEPVHTATTPPLVPSPHHQLRLPHMQT